MPAGIAAALTLHDPTEWPVGLPLVGNDHATVLADLLAADIDTLAADADGRPASLLAALIRQGWLREHAAAAARLIGDPAIASTRDEEFFGIDAGPLGWTAQRDRPSMDRPYESGLLRAPMRQGRASRRFARRWALSPRRVRISSDRSWPARSMRRLTG